MMLAFWIIAREGKRLILFIQNFFFVFLGEVFFQSEHFQELFNHVQ